MKRKIRLKFHARYDNEEEGFVCAICEEMSLDRWVYDTWEIPIHLKKSHRIPRKEQSISGWSKASERLYLKKRKEPVIYDDDSIAVDKTPKRETDREKSRIREERRAQRDSR